MNNSGAWIAASESAALLNGNPITWDGTPIQINNGNAATSQAGINPPEWNMTRSFSDPTMTTKGFYRVKTPP